MNSSSGTSTDVYAWGASEDGQLGIDAGNNYLVPLPHHLLLPSHLTCVKVACGYKHTALLTQDGVVQTCGSNEFNQLARAGASNQFEPVCSIKHKIRDVVCGAYHTAAITETGRLYMWGCNTNGQLTSSTANLSIGFLEPFSDHNVVQVSLGVDHSLALTVIGELFAWGANFHGQLGLGRLSDTPVTQPKRITSLANLPIRQIAAGGSHSLAVTPSGFVYAWGLNSSGQLGIGSDEKPMSPEMKPSTSESSPVLQKAVPTLVRALNGKRVVYVTCGEAHTAVLTLDGDVYTFGDSRRGQVGHLDCKSNVPLPRHVAGLEGKVVTQIACGRAHTVALVPRSGRVYTFGAADEGQLGVGDAINRFSPVVIKGPWVAHCKSKHILTRQLRVDGVQQHVVQQIYSGGNHCFLVAPALAAMLDKPTDFRPWRPCAPCNIATAYDCVLEKFDSGTESTAFLPVYRKRSTTATSLSKVSDISAFCDQLSPMSALKRLKLAFYSVAGLASSCLVDSDTRSHYSIGRVEHGMDLDAAYDLQVSLFLKLPPLEIRRFINKVMDAVLTCANSNYPGVECLRAFLFLSVSPLLNTPRETQKSQTDTSRASATSEESVNALPQVQTTSVNFIDGVPVDWYPVAMAGFTSPGLVLGFFCRAINRLDPVPLRILDSWFGTFQLRHFRRLVGNLNNLVVQLLDTLPVSHGSTLKLVETGLHNALEVMKRLYQVNENKRQSISYSSFYIPELKDRVNVEGEFLNWLMQRNSASMTMEPFRRSCAASSIFSFCDYPFIFDCPMKASLLALEAKVTKFKAFHQARQTAAAFMPFLSRIGYFPPNNSILLLEVRRERLLEDTINYLVACSPNEFAKPFRVKFKDEEAVDEGGVMKEFFMLIMREILNPMYGMFRHYPDSRMIWFSPSTMEDDNMFHIIGILCGMAIYNSIIVDLSFPQALFKKLLKESPNLDDLKDLDPVVGNSLQQLLDYEPDDFEDVFGLTFEISFDHFGQMQEKSLIEGGESIAVTQLNKQLYVDKYVEYVFNVSCEGPFSAFYSGFHNVCGGYCLQLFRPTELQSMVVGSELHDWSDLRKNATYLGEYWDHHPIIDWFWDVLLNECSLTEKKNFLRFLTGCDRVPIIGLQGVMIKIQPVACSDFFLPVAHTCFNLLDLPKYSSKQILSSKFHQAICHTEGFGLV